jgi:membrane associated rhomboid family serine protease
VSPGRNPRGVLAIAALAGVIVLVIGGQYVRPAITTHLLAFGLGILYGVTLRRRESSREAPHHERPVG